MNIGILFTLLVVLGGVMMAVQAPTNALLAKAAGSPITAALISFAVGTVALMAITLATGGMRITAPMKDLPGYAWTGGLYGAYFVVVIAFVTPQIGVGAMLTAAVAGQLLAALVLDHFGLLGLDRQPANAMRVAGLFLVFVGAVMVRRG